MSDGVQRWFRWVSWRWRCPFLLSPVPRPARDGLPILLFGLFRELVANGVPIGVRDFLDGLRALQLGIGQGDRKRLRDLAQTLWARSDEERRLIARWFDVIPQPTLEFAELLDQKLSEADRKVSQDRFGEKLRAARESMTPDLANRRDMASAETDVISARVSFGSTREGEGLTLPRLLAAPAIGEEYILHPQTLVSSRDMAVLWRRYRRTTRRGPRTELDIAGTVRDRCRKGVLRQAVCRPRRSNSVRLLVLADASPSMAPWLPFLATLDNSLQFGRFASAEVRYFTNLPRKQLYANADLVDPEPRDDVLRRFAGASLLVVSDGGSARGYLNRRRAVQTSEFLAEATHILGTIVWLNPMPRPRWVNTTAALIASDPRATTLPLDPGELLRAIDILRGNK